MTLHREEWNRIHRLLESCAREAAHDLPLPPFPPRAVDDSGRELVVAQIGFDGEVMRGALTLSAASELVRALYPNANRLEMVTREDIADWMCEFTNQILGRFLNRLLAFGFEAQTALPSMMWGYRFRLAAPNGDGAFAFRLDAGTIGKLNIRFDATAQSSADLRALDVVGHAVTEGDLVTF